MVFGMSTACFFPNSYLEQTVELIGSMGIQNIEVFFNCMAEYQIPYVKELKKRIDGNGMKTYSIHALSLQFEPQLFSRYQRARQESLDILKQVLEAGAALGAGVYVFHGPSHVKRATKLNLDYGYVAEHADHIADIAKQYGIKLAWENVHWCWYAKPDFATELITRVNTDNLYFTLDVKQAAQSGYDPSDYLYMAKDRLVNIHLCDYIKAQNEIIPRLPFEGHMDFNAIKEALTKTKYDEALILEVYSSNYTSLDHLRNNYLKTQSFFTPTF